jgi:hypothetical protein
MALLPTSIFEGSTFEAQALDCVDKLCLKKIPSRQILESLDALHKIVAQHDYRDPENWRNLRLTVVALVQVIKQNECTFGPICRSSLSTVFHRLLEPHEIAENDWGTHGIDEADEIVDMAFLRNELANVSGNIVVTDLGLQCLQATFPEIARLASLSELIDQPITTKPWEHPDLPPQIINFFQALEEYGGQATSAQLKSEIHRPPASLWYDYPKWKSHLDAFCDRPSRGLFQLRSSPAPRAYEADSKKPVKDRHKSSKRPVTRQ